MAPAYTLTYFDVEGVAESVRYLFNYGGIEFEDKRVSQEEWAKMKPTVEFGMLPLLTHNGKTVGQSMAIARYVGRLVKLNGKNEWEDLEIDSIIDTLMVDWKSKMSAYRRETDEEKKIALKVELVKSNEFYMTKLNEAVGRNNGYLAAGHLTWADLVFASFSHYILELQKYPNLKKLVEKVHALPNIKKWLEKRPPVKPITL